tara:strand:- start:654 stop:1157 length:504 start_codon:yes stop_codon:yes gene_type:complete
MAQLTQTITESITLDTGSISSTTTETVDDIVDVYKRILTIPSGADVIAAAFVDAIGADTDPSVESFDKQNIRYIRITNIDTTNPITVNILIDVGAGDTADGNIAHLLEAGKSLILWGKASGGLVATLGCSDSSASAIAPASDIVNITLDSVSATAKCELLIASTVIS